MYERIYTLVFAKDSDSAFEIAREVAPQIEGFDSFFVASYEYEFGKDCISMCSEFPPALQVSTARFPTDDKRGMQVVNYAMGRNRSSFKRNMVGIRYMIANYTDDELFDGVEHKGKVFIEIEGVSIHNKPRIFREDLRYACGYFHGADCWLYDFRGKPITSFGYLKQLLNDSDSDPFYIDDSEGQDPDWGPHIWCQPLWIVPFDVEIKTMWFS